MSPKFTLLATALLVGGWAVAEEPAPLIVPASQIETPAPEKGDPFLAAEPAESADANPFDTPADPAPESAPQATPAGPGVYEDEAVAPMVIDPNVNVAGCSVDACGDEACVDGCTEECTDGCQVVCCDPCMARCFEEERCCCKYLRYCKSTCNLYQHYPYFPMYHGTYYFRPYNWENVVKQRCQAEMFGADPNAPYANKVVEDRMAELVETDPEARRLKAKLPGLMRLSDDLPDLEELLKAPTPPEPGEDSGDTAPPAPSPTDDDGGDN